MNRTFLFIVVIISVLLQACNTLLNTSTIKMEVAVPAKVKIPSNYKNVVVRYNNINLSYNPLFASYSEGENIILDTTNLDSIASETYFSAFIKNLHDQLLFDSVKVLTPGDFSDIKVVNNRNILGITSIDTLSENDSIFFSESAWFLGGLLKFLVYDSLNHKREIKNLDPYFGLYTKEDIQQIADTTNADLLMSLDFFGSYDGIYFDKFRGWEIVFIDPYWSMYDLKQMKEVFLYSKEDTAKWSNPDIYNLKSAIKLLPPRKNAVLSAAEISAANFAQYITPHWLQVDRMYYKSGNKEMRKAEKLMKQNKWLEAAEIWKKTIKSKNKQIVAKSMFNLALACEMEGDVDAAIDWTVKSYSVFRDKNEDHYYNCMDYIRILGQRKLDIRLIDNHLNPTEESSVN